MVYSYYDDKSMLMFNNSAWVSMIISVFRTIHKMLFIKQEERNELENALRHLEQRLKSPTPSRTDREKSPKEMTYEDRIQVSITHLSTSTGDMFSVKMVTQKINGYS